MVTGQTVLLQVRRPAVDSCGDSKDKKTAADKCPQPSHGLPDVVW
jgi:hypothetical protein